MVSKVLRSSTELYGWRCVSSQVLREFYEALRVATCGFEGFTRILRSPTGGAVFSLKFYDSTGGAVCFRKFYWGSTEVYGWLCVFSRVLRGFYGALRVVLGFL